MREAERVRAELQYRQRRVRVLRSFNLVEGRRRLPRMQEAQEDEDRRPMAANGLALGAEEDMHGLAC